MAQMIDTPDTAEHSSELAGLTMAEIADLLDMDERTELPGGIIVGRARVNADKAKLLLTANTHNRGLSADRVNSFARMMRKGLWLFNGATIGIGIDALLQDGQHRLEAVTLTDTEQDFLFVLGLPPEAQDVTDTGRKRSASDALGIHGVPNAANAASMVRLLIAWAAGAVLHASHTVGNIEIWEFVGPRVDEINESVNVGMAARANGVPIAPSVVSAFHFRLRGMSAVDPAAIDQFFARVCQGVDLTEGDPEYALRRMFLRRAQTGVRASRAETLYYLIRAWNARVKGERLSKMQLPRTPLRNDTFPEPIASASQVDTTAEDAVDRVA